MRSQVFSIACLLSLTVLVGGCAPDNSADTPVMQDSHDHDHGHGHAHPETLADAFHALEELRDTVRDAFAENDTETAHGPLHDVGHLLGTLDSLAGKSELSDEAKAEISKNVETLMNAFGDVDEKMHNSEKGVEYSEVSEKIDAALDAIEAAAGDALDHDHDDDHDHEDHDDHDDDEHGEHDDDQEAEADDESDDKE